MTWVFWVLLALAVLVGLALLSLWSTGRFAKRHRGAPSTALPPGQGTALDDLMTALLADHPDHDPPGQSGVALIDDPTQALALRLGMAQLAGRSLDLLYYIWDDDLSGRLLAKAILESADRGTRVRMLLDDVNVLNRDPVYRALDRHPRIDVRLFNPIRNRDRGFLRGLEILFNLIPLNRRMHGKLWIADGRLALTGGRNIGDAYFAMLDKPGDNYNDLDTLFVGAGVPEAAHLFDLFWNAGVALPIRTLWPGKRTRLRRSRGRLARYLNAPAARARLAALSLPPPDEAATALNLGALHWTAPVTFLGDPPSKALGADRDGWMPEALAPLLRGTTQRLRIMTPYFVPGPEGLAELVKLAKSGVQVQVITNGLALADNVLVHGAYRWYRSRLLAAGVQVFEVSAQSGPRRMLHSKAFLIDDSHGFVGSFNFDLRSAFLNTEMGVVFDDPALVAALHALFDATTAADQAFAVRLKGRWPEWVRGTGPGTLLEPESNALKRAVSFVVGHLPIHKFL